jgi:phosphonate degradation associated HDIG domain protein
MTRAVIDEIFAMFREFGGVTYGEHVTQLAHVLQAAHCASEDKAPDSLIAAALLHDIGQFMNDAGNAAEKYGIDARHEVTGAAFLAQHFPADVVEPIRLHVDAKRYLCAVEPGYLADLSHASAISLALQGGVYSVAEAEEFASRPFFEEAVRLRRYDDMGKRPDWRVPGLETYRGLLESQLMTA